jgi:hypothetical protein
MLQAIHLDDIFPGGDPPTDTLLRYWQEFLKQYEETRKDLRAVIYVLERGGSYGTAHALAEDYAHIVTTLNHTSHRLWALLVEIAHRGVKDPTHGPDYHSPHLEAWRAQALTQYQKGYLRAPQPPHVLSDREIEMIARRYAR